MTQIQSPNKPTQYRDMSEQEATADFERKNAHYMAIYETVQESEDFSFLKVRQRLRGCCFCLNLRRRPRRIPTTL